MSLTVSVVIPSYNHERFLPYAVESALAQTHSPAEVIVVDDGSTDRTPEVMERYRGRVRYVRQANAGVSATRNRGAAVASGEVLAFLDADDVWKPTKLERQVERLAADSTLGLVHCGMEIVDANGDRTGDHPEGLEGDVAEAMILFTRPVVLGGGSGAAIRRAAFDDVGGFDERLSTSADWDFHYRVSARWPVGFVRERLLQYRVHGSNMHGNIGAMERDMLLAFRKAFDEAPPGLSRLRRRAYGNLYAVIAGSAFSVGRYAQFLTCAAKSVALTPGNLGKFIGYPLRRVRRAVPTPASPGPSSPVA